jgi:hypothetical protein
LAAAEALRARCIAFGAAAAALVVDLRMMSIVAYPRQFFFVSKETSIISSREAYLILQPIPADMIRISIGMPNFYFEMPNLDCTSKEISIQSTIVAVRKWLTESRFGISKFGIPILYPQILTLPLELCHRNDV